MHNEEKDMHAPMLMIVDNHEPSIQILHGQVQPPTWQRKKPKNSEVSCRSVGHNSQLICDFVLVLASTQCSW